MSSQPHRIVIPALFLLILVTIWGVSHLEFVPHESFEIVPAQAISGDEPHYLMITNSILFDHDLDLKDDYRRVMAGGSEAGALFRGFEMQHHTVVVDRLTGEHASQHRPAFRWRNPDGSYHQWMIGIGGHLVPEAEVYEISSHPVAMSAIFAGVIAPFRPGKDQVEQYFALVMVLLGWLGTLLTYNLARQNESNRCFAMVPVAIMVFASPWLTYSRSFDAEVPIGVALLLALWAFVKHRPILAALAVALAMFMKPPFILIGFAFALELAYARRWRSLVQLVAVLAASAAVLMIFNYWMARTLILPPLRHPRWGPLPGFLGRAADARGSYPDAYPHSGSLSAEIVNNFRWFFNNLLKLHYGLLWYTPWAGFSFWALARVRGRSFASDDILAAISLPILIYFLMLGSLAVFFRGFTPGYCYGPRYWVPLLPWLALAFGRFFESSGPRMRWCMGAAVAAAAVISFSGALRYPHLFDQPFYASLTMQQATTHR